MRYPEPLTAARLLRRYKRFLADVELPDGTETVAHCGNPGSMMGLATPESRVFLSRNTNPKAKLDWRWEIASQHIGPADGTPAEILVGINTGLANRIVEDALNQRRIKLLSGYLEIRREVKYGEKSRIDFLLPGTPDVYLEVKSVTLRRPEGTAPTAAEFPDAVTKRGAKHLDELSAMVAAGKRAIMFYLVQRADCSHVRLAQDIDPDYARAFDRARAAGVELLCYDCLVEPEGIDIKGELPFERA